MDKKTKSNQNLPSGWRKVKLGEVADISYGKDLPTRKLKPAGFPVYGGNGIIGYSDKYLFEDPKIIIGCRGAYSGNIFRTKPKSFVTHNSLILNFKDETIDELFIFYKLLCSNVKSTITGSAQPQITITELEQLELDLPSSEEQKRIADILSAFDDKIEVNNKISRTLEEMVQAIFKDWFVKKSKFKKQSAKLNKLVKAQYGYTESASDKKIGPKFLRVTDINKADWIDWDSVPYCKINSRDFSKYKLSKGDVVIARMADPGKVAIVEEDIDAVFASYLIRLQIVSDYISPYFLFYYLRSSLYQNFIFGASTGTTRQSANARVITDVELEIPPKEKIIEFEHIASVIREKIRLNVNENQKLAALRDLLLPKLMNGEIKL